MDSSFARSWSIPSRGPTPAITDWGPPSLDEALTDLADALVDEPDQVRVLLVSLENALAAHAAAIGTVEPYADDVFMTSRYQRKLDRLRRGYARLGEEALGLYEAEQLSHGRVRRLITRVERVQSEENRLILDAVWTDLGSVD